MGTAVHIRPPSRRDPAARAITRDWRRLTGGGRDADRNRRTLIACSAGADSSALALALAAAGRDLVLAHVVHDLRPAHEALADRDAARALAEALGLEFAEARAHSASMPGNDEANARRARLNVLESLAIEHGTPYVATAHHADDQLETVLMRLMRGSGPRGLAGIRESRPLGAGAVTMIRPMLAIERAETERLCAGCGWAWREDRTNADDTRTRAALRRRVLPELRAIRADAAIGATRSARVVAEASDALEARAQALLAEGEPHAAGARRWTRPRLRAEPAPVLAALLRQIAARLGAGAGLDRLNAGALERAVAGIRARSGETRRFRLGRAEVTITGNIVGVRAVDEGVDRVDGSVPGRGDPDSPGSKKEEAAHG